MSKRVYYGYTSAQDVCHFQLLFSLFKNIINVTSSFTWEEEIDHDLLEKTFNICAERNDTLRVYFTKKNGKNVQYFRDHVEYKLPSVSFNTKEEQDAWFVKLTSTATKWKKGEVVAPWFVKTYKGHSMLVLKACHMALDTYGSVNLYKDIDAVYHALKNNTEMPPLPGQFEDLLKKDLSLKFNKEKKAAEAKYFTEMLGPKEPPHFSCICGNDIVEDKRRGKEEGHRSIKLPFIQNQTYSLMLPFKKEAVKAGLEYCKENNIPVTDFFFHITNLSCYVLNEIKYTIPFGLSNCRATKSERTAAGDKAQSYQTYVEIKEEQSFKESMQEFEAAQVEQLRHIGFDDVTFQGLLHKIYDFAFDATLAGFMFSMVPSVSSGEFGVSLHSNGRFPLPCYMAVMLDAENEDLKIAYETQKVYSTPERIERFNHLMEEIVLKVCKNPDVKVKDLLKLKK